MATTYLTSTTDLAAANWDDATGHAEAADLVVNIPGLNVQTGLDQSAVTNGIDSFDIQPPAAGKIGGAGASYTVEANTGVARVTNHGRVEFYFASDGTTTNFDCGSSSTNYITGGTVTNVTVQGGAVCNVKAAAVVTNFYANGGSGVIEDNATALTLAVINSGTWVIKREVTALIVGPRADVTIDTDASVVTAATLNGGIMRTKTGNVPTLTLNAGTVDKSRASKALTIGGTAFSNRTSKSVKGTDLVTVSNETFPGGLRILEPTSEGVPPGQ